MLNRANSQIVHMGISIFGVVAAAFGAYYGNQIVIERFMARIDQTLASHVQRITRLEERQQESGTDRLSMERRVTGLEVGQNTILGVLKEMRDDIRAMRDRQP
jgi:hypothetical protein